MDYNLCKSENKLVINYNENEIKDEINKEEKGIDNKEFNEEENDIDLSDNNFSKLKEDFNLLYNLDYISKINEDLLKLETELFIEKMSELFSEYHTQMDEKILEKKLINREYEIHFEKYLLYNKLKDRLEFIKKKYKKEKGIRIKNQNIENIKTNLDELDLFKIILPDLIGNNANKNKKNELKNILSIILKKEENKDLIKEKYEKLKIFL